MGNLKGLRTNQAFTSGSTAPQPATYQQADYTYDGDTGLAGQFTSHRWLTRLKQTFHGVSANTTTLLVQNDYTYDAAGQRTSNLLSSIDPTTGNLTSRTEAYGYDELNRLTSVDYGDGETQSYTFDSMGNRTGKSDTISGTTTSESYVVNAANMLTSRTVGSTTNAYTNDSNGNTLTGGGRTNTWDSENRMTKCVNGANTSTFTYGSDGIRHSSVVNGVSTNFVLDNSMFVRELSSTGGVKATYFMGASGPAYRRDDANGGTVRWYLYDGLGSVLGEVDPSGNITARRKYDVYGATRAGSDAGTSKHKFVGSLGHPSEDETGLVYMQARHYDPQTGRFVSEDPSLQDKNWYIYANDDPVTNVDMNGRSWKNVAFVIGGFAAGIFFTALAMERIQTADSISGFIPGKQLTALSQAQAAATCAVGCFALAAFGTVDNETLTAIGIGLTVFSGAIQMMVAGARAGSSTPAKLAVYVTFAYMLCVEGFVIAAID